MKKFTLITIFYLLISNFSFAQTYPASCPDEARAIVEAVGGCAEVDNGQYSAVYDNCCAVSATSTSRGITAVWVALALVAVGFGAFGIRHRLRKK